MVNQDVQRKYSEISAYLESVFGPAGRFTNPMLNRVHLGMMTEKRVFICDWCGTEMVSRHCKEICPNCGQRWDCSDTTIWIGEATASGTVNPRKDS
jgi:rubrerythrin